MLVALYALPWFALGAAASFLLVRADYKLKMIINRADDNRWPLHGPTD